MVQRLFKSYLRLVVLHSEFPLEENASGPNVGDGATFPDLHRVVRVDLIPRESGVSVEGEHALMITAMAFLDSHL